MENPEDFSKLPSVEELKAIIASINEADLSQVSYNKLVNAITTLQFVPFVTAKLKKGHTIKEINQCLASNDSAARAVSCIITNQSACFNFGKRVVLRS